MLQSTTLPGGRPTECPAIPTLTTIRTATFRAAAGAIMLTLISGSGAAQQPAPPGALAELSLRSGTIQNLVIPDAAAWTPLSIELVLGGKTRTLHLRPHDMRPPGFQVWLDDGARLHPVTVDAPRTYRGRIEGETDAFVAASVEGGRLYALLEAGGERWGVQPAPTDGARDTRHVVYRTTDLAPSPFRCAALAAPVRGMLPGPATGTGRNVAPWFTEIAIEVDSFYFDQMGRDTNRVVTDVWRVVNPIDLIYQRDTDIAYLVRNIIIGTTDHYGTSNPGTLLDRMRARWRSTYASIHRDVGHLFTGRDLDGNTIGIAWIGTICGDYQYGLSQTLFSTNLTERAGLTAHELGHNWNAGHCSGADCRIMCDSLNGCGQDLTRFGAASRASITAFRDTVRGCLDGFCGNHSDGGGIAYTNLDGDPRPEMVLVAYDEDPSGANSFNYLIGYNVDRDSSTTDWAFRRVAGLGDVGEGADVAIGNLDGDPRPDMLLMANDAPSGPNQFRYRVLWNLDQSGTAASISDTRYVPGVGDLADGAGMAIGNIDSNPRPDVVLMAYDRLTGANEFRYRILWNLDTSGTAAAVSNMRTSPGVGHGGEGAGVALGNVDLDPRPDMVLMAYDAAAGPNEFRFHVLYNLDGNGVPQSRTPVHMSHVGLGDRGEGAGIALVNLNTDERCELVFMAIDDAGLPNQFRWHVRHDFCRLPGSFSTFGSSCPSRMVHSGGGLPQVGEVVDYRLSGAPLFKPAFLALGRDRNQWLGIPLPFDLGVLGAPGCFVYTDHLQTVQAFTTPFGTASVGVQLPNDTSLLRQHIYTQYLVVDPAQNPLGIAVSHAVDTFVGS